MEEPWREMKHDYLKWNGFGMTLKYFAIKRTHRNVLEVSPEGMSLSREKDIRG